MELAIAKTVRLFKGVLVTCNEDGQIPLHVETVGEYAEQTRYDPSFVISAEVLDTLLRRAGIHVVGGRLAKPKRS